jgi:hypothetical protein
MKPAGRRLLAEVQAELGRVVRYDDESIVHEKWVRQRYDCGCFPSLQPARRATVETAWHEAGHAVAALAIGARFSSASIHHGRSSEGRVHGICGADELSFVVDAAGQVAQRLRTWTMLDCDEELRAWLPTWHSDGGDARRFRAAAARLGGTEVAVWRHCEQVLTPLRLHIREVARALLVHPRYLPYEVIAAVAAVR